jgi:hypothetical protein
MISIKFTKKKFYNKWEYKISLRLVGASVFRNHNYESIKQTLTGTDSDISAVWFGRIIQQPTVNKEHMYAVADFLSKCAAGSFITRIESGTIDIYTNNEQLFDTASQEFMLFTWKRFAPDPNTQHLLQDNKKIISKKLAHGKYQYKVFLTPHKLANDVESKQRFVQFVRSQEDRIRMSAAVEHWFINTRWNWDPRYVFADNQKTLLLLKLAGANAVGSVYEYVVPDK